MKRAAAPSLFDHLGPAAVPLAVKLPAADVNPPAADVNLGDAEPTRAQLALLAWRVIGGIRGSAQDLRMRLERTPGAAEWTAQLDAAHQAVDALMRALSEAQGAAGAVAHAEILGEEPQEEANA